MNGPDVSSVGSSRLPQSELWLRLGAAAALLTVFAAMFWLSVQPVPPVPKLLAVPGQRVAPDLRRVPVSIPQGGDWRGIDAFPNLSFDQPIRLIPQANSNQLCVFERCGRIFRFENDPQVTEKHLFLDLRDRILPNHRGPIDMAFHPDFGKSGSGHSRDFFVFYKRRDGFDVVSRFKVAEDGASVDSATETVLVEQKSSKTHAGGAMTFGLDGFLYFATGEERSTDQTIDQCLHGGVFRIDVDMIGGQVSHPPPRQPLDGRTQHYYIPSDNPFVGRPNALEEFWALGLRNPFTMTVDRGTGEIWIGEVGRNTWEEINLLKRGANYEWSYREGPMIGDRMEQPGPSDYVGTPTPPTFSYLQAEGNNSIIGGYVYRGRAYPQLQGKYIYGDNGSSRIWALTPNQSGQPINETLCQIPAFRFEGVCGFGEDADGELYICLLGNERFDRRSRILKLVPNGASHPPDSQVTQRSDADQRSIRLASHETSAAADPNWPMRLSETGLFTDVKSLRPAPGVIPYTVNVPLWSDNAIKTRWIAVPGDGSSDDPTEDRLVIDGDFPFDVQFPVGTTFVKHFEMPTDGADASTRKRLETRVTVLKAGGGFCAMTYRWNDQQTDAVLLRERATTEIVVTNEDGSKTIQPWTFPDSADCRMCHNSETGFVLGVNVAQLNCQLRDPVTGLSYNQLAAWNDSGLLSGSADRSCDITGFELSSWPRMAALDDETASMEQRARSWLAANCSQCHRRTIPGRPPRPVFDLRYHVPLEQSGLIGPDKAIVAANPERSRLLQRLSSADHMRMPPIGRSTVDRKAAAVIRSWIRSLD